MIKPTHLNPGDNVITLSLSWGGPGACPERYKTGKQQLEQEFGVHVIEGKYTLESPERIYNHPEARAEDLMYAFKNPKVKAIFSTIGGEESIRILPYIDFGVITNNPKIFMGFSDSTITHFMCQKAGIVSFYGPSIMAGFAENGGMFDYMVNAVKDMLFDNKNNLEFIPNHGERTNEFLPWNQPENQLKRRKTQKTSGWNWIQGKGTHVGELIGGCIDVFPFLQGTSIRPNLDDWNGKILCIETSEEKMPTLTFERIIRNLGSQGVLQCISGILLGRSQLNYKTGVQISYEDTLNKVINTELGLYNLPIITNMDFGHTDPMFVLPLGCKTKIDCDKKTISFLESACI